MSEIKLFEQQQIRSVWDETQEKWYFSVVDIVQVLTESIDGRKYWNKLKQRLKEEGNEMVTNCHQLKLKASDGKMRLTDVADMEGILRLIQSIPSPKAEPFKMWLAEVGAERLDELQDPELTINRAMQDYLNLGYSESWINQRLKSIEIRKELTDEWQRVGVKQGKEFAILTDIITKTWSGKNTQEYKQFKGLKKENLRDNMSNTELILNMLAEASTKDISQAVNPSDFSASQAVAEQGGNVAKVARLELESKTGKQVVTRQSAKQMLEKKKENE